MRITLDTTKCQTPGQKNSLLAYYYNRQGAKWPGAEPDNSKPPVKLVVCTYPRRVYCRRTRQRVSKFGNASLISGSRYVAAVFFALFHPVTRKRVSVLFDRHLVRCKVFFQLITNVLSDDSGVLPYCISIVPSTPKISISIFIL